MMEIYVYLRIPDELKNGYEKETLAISCVLFLVYMEDSGPGSQINYG
jgi:hypothetical protein